jgi:hypothetical protein
MCAWGGGSRGAPFDDNHVLANYWLLLAIVSDKPSPIRKISHEIKRSKQSDTAVTLGIYNGIASQSSKSRTRHRRFCRLFYHFAEIELDAALHFQVVDAQTVL